MKKLFALVALTMTVTLSGNVLAHSEKPKHGGIVQESKDLSFELVNKDGKVLIYVEDHGKSKATAGATGKLTVLTGSQKSEVLLEAAGDNVLVTTGEAKLVKGTKAIATVTFADKKTVNVRFSIRS